ncbi:MAG: site-specific DNA-methyltransferase [Candidatus Bathyarchaeia archaeon]
MTFIPVKRYNFVMEASTAQRGIRSVEPIYFNRYGAYFRSDCLRFLDLLRSESIDFCFADPPFNLGKNYGDPSFEDNNGVDEYRRWCKRWLNAVIRVLKPGGTLCVYHLPRWALDLGAWLNERGDVTLRNLIAVKMKNGFPIRGRLHPALYTILYYTKTGGHATFNIVRQRAPTCRNCNAVLPDYGGYRKKYEKFQDDLGVPWIQISDFWEDTRPANQDKARRVRVNELPLHIPERAILMATNKHDIVLDIFAGGGSTLHAAQVHERLWVGCDIGDPTPCLRRFATVFGRVDVSEPHRKIAKCFKTGALLPLVRQKRKAHLIRRVRTLPNKKSLLNIDLQSKSRVLGF